MRARFKEKLDKRGLKGQMRANAAWCLDTSAFDVFAGRLRRGHLVRHGGVKPRNALGTINDYCLCGRAQVGAVLLALALFFLR